MRQTTIQLDNKTEKQIAKLARLWGLPETRHATPVIRRVVDMAITIEAARATLSSSDFAKFMEAMHED